MAVKEPRPEDWRPLDELGLMEVIEASLRLKKKTLWNVVKQIVHRGHIEIAKSSADRAAVTEYIIGLFFCLCDILLK